MLYKVLTGDTRVWIYQSNRPLTKTEVKSIKEQGVAFILRWSAHGAKLNAAFEVFHNQFIALFVDEAQAKASGCSIDKSVRLIKQFETEFDILLLNRDLVAYMNNEQVVTCTREEFVELVKLGQIKDSTIVFNNLVSNKDEFDNKWMLPLKDSWHFELISK